MGLQKKEVITGILVPTIAIAASVINSNNWQMIVLFIVILINTILWLWIVSKKKAIISIIAFSISSLLFSFAYSFSFDNRQRANLEIEPIQIIRDSSNIASKKRFELKTPWFLGEFKRGPIIDRIYLEDESDWEISKDTLGNEDFTEFNRDYIQNFGFNIDSLKVEELYLKKALIWKVEIDHPKLKGSKRYITSFPLISCIIRNNGASSGTIYGLTSKVICEIGGHTMQGSQALTPLNKEFRLYPGKKLMFRTPIVIPVNSIATIQFSPTFKEENIMMGGTPPTMLFSVHAIYYDGVETKEILLGYYRMEETILDNYGAY